VVGVDPAVITAGKRLHATHRSFLFLIIVIASARKLAETLEKNGSKLVGIDKNLVDLVWGKERPSKPSEKVKVHPAEYAGKPFQEKIADLRKELKTKKRAGFVVCM
jgi:Xaa-Pro aminopeptidase